MMTGSRSLVLGCALFAGACAIETDTGRPDAPRTGDPTVYRGDLTPANEAPAVDVVASFLLSRGVDHALVDELVLDRARVSPLTGVTHLRLQQRAEGLPVLGAGVDAAVAPDGRLIYVSDTLVADAPPVAPATITVTDAVRVAIAYHHPDLAARADAFYRTPSALRVAVPLADGGLAEGFVVETWTTADNLLHHTLVSGAGRVLDVQLRTNTDSYNVFAEHPGVSAQAVVSGPGGWLNAGSHRDIHIAGPTTNAYLDRDNDGAPDSGGATISDGNFLAVANLGAEPETGANQAVAVQNLFFLNSSFHDVLELYGFDEAAGNFEGADPVNAEAQDGGGTNNANMSTPSDGSSPRMQMYLWTYSSPKRDGDLDSDIVYHEYCHGLTWRMIGNMSGPMSGAIGEGMSDGCSILMNERATVGSYSYNNPGGIRRWPYDSHPLSYADMTGSSVHADGEIYGAIVYDLLHRFAGAGISKDTLWSYVVGGMAFTPAGPAFEDMRDGILTAAAGSGHECLIWEAFAARGVGVGAKGSIKGGGPFGGGKVNVVESFELPATCGGGSGCTPTEATEVSCSDGADNDCDGAADAADSDCATGGECLPIGASCTSDDECCLLTCRGKKGAKTCK